MKKFDGIVKVRIEARDRYQAEALLAQMVGCPGVKITGKELHLSLMEVLDEQVRK